MADLGGNDGGVVYRTRGDAVVAATTVLAPLLVGLVGALLLTPVSKVLARRVGAIDSPGHLKVHERAMPRFGGSAIWAAAVLASAAATVLTVGRTPSGLLLPVLIGSTLIALIGAIDDAVGLSPKARLAGGLVAAGGTAVFVVGGMTMPLWSQVIAVCAFTLWLVGCANAVNMLDGLDGLAAGVSAIAAVGIGVVALGAGNAPCAILTFGLAGACIGFLRYNFRPASTFMGDVGSLFLGFTLASSVLLLLGNAAGKPVVPFMLGAMVALGVPVGDMLLAMARRLVNHKPIMQGDRSHVYDQLRDRFGFSVVKTVLTMYLLTVVLVLLGIGVSQLGRGQALTATAALVAMACMGALWGGFLRREEHSD